MVSKNTSIRMPLPLNEAMKLVAEFDDISPNLLVSRAVKQYIKNSKWATRPEVVALLQKLERREGI